MTGLRPTVTRILSAGERHGLAIRGLDGEGAVLERALSPSRRSAPRCRARAGASQPAASARRRIAAGSGLAPRRPSPRRRSWRRRSRVRARYSRRPTTTSLPGTSVSARALGRRDHRAAEGKERQLDRLRAGGDHDLLGPDHLRPSSVSTSTVLPSRNRAQPSTILTPAFFSSPETPLLRRPTMPSFQAMVFARSSSGLRHGDAERALAGGHLRDRRRIPRPRGSAPSRECSRH